MTEPMFAPLAGPAEVRAQRRPRLTDQQRADRALPGGDLQTQITDLAEIYGWKWCHWRPLQNRRGFWQVPVEGPLGAGWPDLFMAHPTRGRVLAVEVKREVGDPLTGDQVYVHEILRRAGIEVVVWRPSDMSSGEILEALR